MNWYGGSAITGSQLTSVYQSRLRDIYRTQPVLHWQDFGYFRLKRFHSLGLVIKEPAFPQICRIGFEIVVKYYFPGEAGKSIWG
jgi:hypothetical protein